MFVTFFGRRRHRGRRIDNANEEHECAWIHLTQKRAMITYLHGTWTPIAHTYHSRWTRLWQERQNNQLRMEIKWKKKIGAHREREGGRESLSRRWQQKKIRAEKEPFIFDVMICALKVFIFAHIIGISQTRFKSKHYEMCLLSKHTHAPTESSVASSVFFFVFIWHVPIYI